MKGLVFDIKRFAIHDGPGIRTTVFLKGCPLSCIWCHNPEGISPEACTVPRTVRLGQETFTEEQTVGSWYSTDELMDILRKEIIFMEESGGGVTFSGGEPMLQKGFLSEMLSLCRAEGMHTAVDTSGLTAWEYLRSLLSVTDLFLYDLKDMDDEAHRQHTGVSNKIIHENLKKLLQAGASVRIRVPLIPGITFTEANQKALLDFLQSLPSKPVGVDLLPFHHIANHKYERFQMTNALKDLKNLDKKSVAPWKTVFEAAGFHTTIGG